MNADGWYKRGGDNWRKRYINEFGKRAEFIGYSEKSMSKKAFDRERDRVDEMRKKLEMGLPTPDTRPVTDIIKDWIAWGDSQGGRFGQGWSVGYRKNIVRFVPAIFKRMGVNRLDAVTLQKFEKALSVWSEPGTRRTNGGYVKMFLTWCFDRGLLMRHPFTGWPGKKMIGKRKRRFLTMDEFRSLLSASPKKHAIAYEFAIYTGARSEEFNFIRVDSVDWKNGTVFLPGKFTKNGQDTTFYLPPEFLEKLQDYARFKLPAAKLFDLSINNKDRYFQKHREAAGIPYETEKGFVTFHSLRHTFISYLGMTAGNQATLLRLSRHSDLKTNSIYQHSTADMDREAVAGIYALNKAEFKPKKINEK